MTPRKRKAVRQEEDPPAKRTSKGRAVKKQDDPVWATENPKSLLVSQDLHAKYSDPATYENWTKEDWGEIHDCLPENAPFNEDGYSVPIHFFKYDPDWRRIVREFQEDLGAGRYEPQWLKEATQAMKERAAGKFDKYKEDQFEAFWGQKQTLHHEVRAGESAKIKLAELVKAGLIKVGDEMSYRRSFGRHYGTPWMIEKDLKVVSINGTTLTVAIPPGRLRYPQLPKQPGASNVAPMVSGTIKIGANQEAPQANGTVRAGVEDEENSTSGGVTTGTVELDEGINVPGDDSDPQTNVDSNQSSKLQKLENLSSFGASDAARFNAKPGEHQDIVNPVANNRNNDDENGNPQEDGDITRVISNSLLAPLKNHEDDGESSAASDELKKPDSHDPTATDEVIAKGHESRPTPKQEAIQIDPETRCFLYDVWKPGSLEDKIIEIDGRIDPKDAAAASAWRSIRLLRNNQDLGSLFDIREEHYIWTSSTIVKMPKKGSLGNTHRFEDEGPQNCTKTPRKRAKDSMEEQVSQHTPSSGRNQKSQSATKERVADLSDDGEDVDNIAERSEDDEDIAERDSDGDFGVQARRKKGSKQRSKQRSKLRGRPATEHTSWCPHCGTGFTKEINLKIHIRKTCKRISREENEAGHSPERSLTKDKNDVSGLDRENETKIDEGKEGNPLLTNTCSCPHCGTEFTLAGNLKKHIQKWCKRVPKEGPETDHDRGGGPGKVGVGENGLEDSEGKDRKSTSKQTFSCPYCGTGFAKAGNLKNHVEKRCKQVPAE